MVKILCEGSRPRYRMPWQVTGQESWTGSGFFVRMSADVLYVLTNAHVVNNAFEIRLVLENGTPKQKAIPACIAHEVDLALLSIPASHELRDVFYLPLASDLPPLFSAVSTLGFPEGGSTVCVTKGVVSRIDAQLYAHMIELGYTSSLAATPPKILILQIDAAINAGNSGGPALSADGAVVGVTSSCLDEAQNVGYIIPMPVVTRFLNDYHSYGRWLGICELGFAYRTLECQALREFVGVELNKGVLVTSVAPLGTLHDILEPNDVISTVDGIEIHSDATVVLDDEADPLHLPMDHLFTRKEPNQPIVLGVVRNSLAIEVVVRATALPSLLPRYPDAPPSFAIFGGLVFSPLSVPLYSEIQDSDVEGSVAALLSSEAQKWKTTPERETILLLCILRHSVNDGIDITNALRFLTHVNDKPIHTMEGLVKETLSLMSARSQSPNAKQFLRFSFHMDAANGVSGLSHQEIVNIDDVLGADAQILRRNCIATPVSVDLADVYHEYAPPDDEISQSWKTCLRSLGRCGKTCKRPRTA